MTEPAIQPSQRPTTRPPAQRRESPADLVVRTMAELPNLTGEQASERLGAIRGAVADGTLDGSHESVRLTTRSLERRVSADVQRNAPMTSTASRGRRSRRLEQAATNAWHSAVDAPPEQRAQVFMDSLRSQLGSETAVRGLLLRTPPAAMDEMIMGAGATNEQAREIRSFVGRHFARQFEADVQNHVLNEVSSTRTEFREAIHDDAVLDAAIERFVGPGLSGQQFLRALDVLGVDEHDRLSSLYNRIGRDPSKRAAVLEELRGPFREALREVAGHLDQAMHDASNHFSDRLGSAFTTYATAARQTVREWNLPRNLSIRTAQHGSVIAHAIRERMIDTAGERDFDAAIAAVAKLGIGLVGGQVATFANTAVGVVGEAVEAERQATLATANVGDVGEAEAHQTNAEATVMRTAFSQIRQDVTRPVTEAVNGLAPADGVTGWLFKKAQGQVRRLGRLVLENEAQPVLDDIN